MIHDIPLGEARWQIMALAENNCHHFSETSIHQTDPVFIYEVMALTCGIQALYDNNREVWFASGLRSAGQQLRNRRRLWDDVTTLQNRHNQFAAAREEAGGSRRLRRT